MPLELHNTIAVDEESEAVRLDRIRALLDGGADVNEVKPKTGDTPLHLASARNLRTIAQLLADRGANPFLKNAEGDTPKDLVGADVGDEDAEEDEEMKRLMSQIEENWTLARKKEEEAKERKLNARNLATVSALSMTKIPPAVEGGPPRAIPHEIVNQEITKYLGLKPSQSAKGRKKTRARRSRKTKRRQTRRRR